jgi:hypothetical protein
LLPEVKEQIPFHSCFELQVTALAEFVSIGLQTPAEVAEPSTHVPQAMPHEKQSLTEASIRWLAGIQTA